MNRTVGSLRLRLFTGALGAGLLASLLLAVALLFEVRDALYARRVADAREALQGELLAATHRCGTDTRCLEDALREHGDAGFTLREGPCAAPSLFAGAMVSLCVDLPGQSRSLHLAVPLEKVRDQLSALDGQILLALGAALVAFVLLSIVALERGVVRRLSAVHEALSALDAQGDRPLLPEGGDALGSLGSAMNRLSERLGEERARTQAQIVELQDARSDLIRSERLASAGRLAAGVAHEVGNPLSAVIGYAAMLRARLEQLGDDAPGVKDAREFAERIERESARVDRILRDLLDLARPLKLRLEPIELPQCLSSARSLCAPQALFTNCTVAYELPAPFPKALGEEHYVVQVLVNLFTNAAKAGATNVRVTAHEDAASLFVEIADDGRGIAPEILPRLFEPFVTTASPGEGTGLGLALSHATMERLSGSITARAGEVSGAIFTLRFRKA